MPCRTWSCHSSVDWRANSKRSVPALRILIAITGASGSLYAQRLLDNLSPAEHEIHVVVSHYAQAVLAEELPRDCACRRASKPTVSRA